MQRKLSNSRINLALKNELCKRAQKEQGRKPQPRPWPPHGTVFAAGSLQGPGCGSAPMARTRTHIRAPQVRSVSVPLDLATVSFFCQLVGETGSTLTSTS